VNFLAPLFLAAAAAIALPIWWHLIRRRPRTEIQFSATRFLTASVPRITRRSRVENWLLLLLRCLAILFLACAFARPFLTQPLPALPGQNITRHRVVLVDSSASMRRPDLWKDAQSAARKALEILGPDDSAAVFTFDRQPTELTSFEEWSKSPSGERVEVALSKLANTQLSWDRTETAGALIQAARRIQDQNSGKDSRARKEIHLITDFQEGSRLQDLRGFTWPKDIEVTLVTLSPASVGNATLLASVSQELGVPLDKRVRVRGQNGPDTRPDRFQAEWIETVPNRHSVLQVPDWLLPPGQSRPLLAPTNATFRSPTEIRIAGDKADFDNTFFLAPIPSKPTEVGWITGTDREASDQVEFYLRNAFPTNSEPKIVLQKYGPKESTPAQQAPNHEASTPLIALLPTDSQNLSRLQSALAGGASVFAMLATPDAAPQLASLLALPSIDLIENSGQDYQLLADIDFAHALFRPLSDARFNDFTKIHFWKHRRLQTTNLPNTRIVARFENQAPAILESEALKGRLFVFTSTWSPSDSQLALSSKFVPLLYSFLDLSGALSARPSQLLVGTPIEAIGRGAQQGSVVRPDAKTERFGENGTYARTDLPGFYHLQPEDRWVAVNLPPEESRTKPLQPDDLERLGVTLSRNIPKPDAAELTEKKRTAQHAVTLESQQRLWRWFLLAALITLALETFIAQRTPSTPQLSPEPPAA